MSGEHRRASLTPRQLGDYVPPASLEWITGGAAAAAVLGVLFLVLPRDESFVGPAEVVITALGAAGFAGATRLLGARILERPQPTGSPLTVATDDTIRASGVRAVVGAGAAGVSVALAAQLFALSTTDVQVLRWTMGVASLLAFGLAFGTWRTVVDSRNYPKGRPPGPAANPTA